MEIDKSRTKVILGSAGAVLLLLSAFLVVWLMPRGPEPGSAAIETPSVGSSSASIAPAPAPVDSGISAGKSVYSPAGAQSVSPYTDQPHITVRGSGVISAKPDMANLQLGVQIQQTKLSDAQAEAATKMDAVMAQLKGAGIDEKDISTSQYNVEPVMNYRDNQPPQVTGFRVTNMVNVKIRDLSKAGALIDNLINSGANSVYGLSFGFSDPSALMRQAREQAMVDAKAKAEQYAQFGGVTLGTPIVIDDAGVNIPPVPMMADMAAGMERSMAANTPIAPGQQEIRVDVAVVYGIK